MASKEASGELNKRLSQNLKQLLSRLQLGTRRTAARVAALVVADSRVEDATATRSQPCAGSHQLYAQLVCRYNCC
jgi:hypothetical protein